MLIYSETGPLFHIPSIPTTAGPLKLVKIRIPIKSEREMGDADFTINDYFAFKKKVKQKPGFTMMKREDYELIELADPSFRAKAYFSNRPIDKELGI